MLQMLREAGRSQAGWGRGATQGNGSIEGTSSECVDTGEPGQQAQSAQRGGHSSRDSSHGCASSQRSGTDSAHAPISLQEHELAGAASAPDATHTASRAMRSK